MSLLSPSPPLQTVSIVRQTFVFFEQWSTGCSSEQDMMAQLWWCILTRIGKLKHEITTAENSHVWLHISTQWGLILIIIIINIDFFFFGCKVLPLLSILILWTCIFLMYEAIKKSIIALTQCCLDFHSFSFFSYHVSRGIRLLLILYPVERRSRLSCLTVDLIISI